MFTIKKSLHVFFKYIQILLLFVFFDSRSQSDIDYANQCYNTKKYDLAIKKINHLLATDDKNRDALLLKSICLIEMHKNNEALDLLLILKTLNPQDGDVYFLKAFAEWRLNRFQVAMKSLNDALVYQPDNKYALFLSGILCYELNLHVVAKHHFDQANDVSNELASNHFSKKRLLKSYKSFYVLQYRVFDALTLNETQNYKPWFYKGLFKAISNDNYSAISDLEKSTEINRNSELPYFYKGYTFATIKKYDKALEHLAHFHVKSENKYNIHELLTSLKNTLEISTIIFDGLSEKPLLIAEKMPKFGASAESLQQYLASNVTYPSMASLHGIEGTVVVSFVIESSGQVANPVILKSIGGGCEAEAMRVIQKMPNWHPGSQNGKNVAIKITIPIKFKLN